MAGIVASIWQKRPVPYTLTLRAPSLLVGMYCLIYIMHDPMPLDIHVHSICDINQPYMAKINQIS